MVYFIERESVNAIKKYFDVKIVEEESEEEIVRIEINSPHIGGIGNVHIFYNEENGRILLIRECESGCDEFILLFPTGDVEIDHILNHFDKEEMEYILSTISRKISEFHQNLLKKFYEARYRFNQIFRQYFNVDFNFFKDSDEIINLHPFFSRNLDSFLIFISSLYTVISEINMEMLKSTFSIQGSGSLNILESILKEHNILNDELSSLLKDLRVIVNLRNMRPIHKADEKLHQFLKRFDKKYPSNEKDWCDLACWIVRKVTEIINKISDHLESQ